MCPVQPNQRVSVLLGGVPCASTQSVDHQTAVCITRPGAGALLVVAADVGGQVSEPGQVTFSYSAPRITNVTLSAPSPTGGGGTLSMFGYNFGPADESATTQVRIQLFARTRVLYDRPDCSWCCVTCLFLHCL